MHHSDGIPRARLDLDRSIDAIQYYLADVIANSGIKKKREQSGKSFDKHGRRFCLTVSLVGMACALPIVGLALTFQDGTDPVPS
eukprot:scaffold6438_cov181-Amphora_coffeaeformis.AAC.9